MEKEKSLSRVCVRNPARCERKAKVTRGDLIAFAWQKLGSVRLGFILSLSAPLLGGSAFRGIEEE